MVFIFEGENGQCTHADDCAETGTKTRIDRVCENGIEVERIETKLSADCERDTTNQK